ncbi:hypothetical protein AVEN_250044-1 [Araneus ventricosus]|uniref:Uncharacterized protein n=1 Tax=Araneus ventricosus TaxID=182803 RepID=A0A4Y2Q9C7_ARAVE|nr:hypothetical protein AVEN_250044-1 [Araneus ventricosus]
MSLKKPRSYQAIEVVGQLDRRQQSTTGTLLQPGLAVDTQDELKKYLQSMTGHRGLARAADRRQQSTGRLTHSQSGVVDIEVVEQHDEEAAVHHRDSLAQPRVWLVISDDRTEEIPRSVLGIEVVRTLDRGSLAHHRGLLQPKVWLSDTQDGVEEIPRVGDIRHPRL